MSELVDNYYVRLGVPRDATPEEIRRAYHQAARRLHPDANPSPGAVEQFLRIQEAYDTLFDAEKRAEYDKSLAEVDPSPSIAINTLYSRPGLLQTTAPQLIYVLLEITPIAAENEPSEIPLNLCIVVDRSTSMQGARMDIVKATAKRLVQQLRPIDYLSIVAFSDRAEVIVPAARGYRRDRLEAQISLLQTGGGTEIYKGLQAGMTEVTRFLRPNHINHLVLITDGHTYGDEENCLKLADEAKEQGITISGLGIGNEWNDKFLDMLAEKTGGNSVYVTGTRDIQRFLELKFRELNNIFAENTTLQFENNPNVEIQYAFRLQPEPSNISLDTPLKLGNVYREESLKVIFELLVKGHFSTPSYTLLDGALKLEVPARTIPTVRHFIKFSRPVYKKEQKYSPPSEIVQAMSRLTLYRMQEQAKQDMEEGNIEQATRRLRYLATHLLAQGESTLATAVLGEAGRLERGSSFSEEGGKRIKYGTRALLLPPGTEVKRR